MSLSPASIVFSDATFVWPDGTTVLAGVTASFGRGRTGLVGANGAGKSTLLSLITGERQVTAGSLVIDGSVDRLPQDVTRTTGTLAGLLGIARIREAVRRIESGSVEPALFDIVGDDWDIEARAAAALAAQGLPPDLDRPVAALSGGEAVLAAVLGIRLRARDIALLDEPTNNLDGDARALLYEMIDTWHGTLVVASHDVDLLDRLDATAQLRGGRLTVFGGGYGEFREQQAAQRQAAEQTLRTAEQRLRRERQARANLAERDAHSTRQGRKDRADRKYVPAVINDRRNSAEKTQGARRDAADAKVDAAQAAVQAAGLAVRGDDAVRIDLPDPDVAAGRRMIELPSADGRNVLVVGPERIALVGPNGVGKTTLVERALAAASVRVGYLPQRIAFGPAAGGPADPGGAAKNPGAATSPPVGEAPGRTAYDVIREACPAVPPAVLTNRLARLLLRGTMLTRPVGSLSGGERFRVALARLVLADPPPQLLMLDEPTNNLDLATVDQLVEVLRRYRGALLVVSHDRRFLDRIGAGRVLALGRSGSLRVTG